MSFFLDESQCKITDNTKTVLKLEYPSGQHIQVVFKQSRLNKGMIFFAVFMRIGDLWTCQGTGYHSDIKAISEHIYRKYIEHRLKGVIKK